MSEQPSSIPQSWQLRSPLAQLPLYASKHTPSSLRIPHKARLNRCQRALQPLQPLGILQDALQDPVYLPVVIRLQVDAEGIPWHLQCIEGGLNTILWRRLHT